jgi:ABC-type Co2+ transport system permease subunit
MRKEHERELWTWAAAISVYSATAIIDFVIPLGKHFGDRLLGTALFAPDPILNAGILEWGYRSLWSPARHVFEWNAGFPLQDSLAVTENLIGWQLFYTPLRTLAGPVAAYNLLLLISFVLSGLGAALLTRRLGADRCGSVVAGFIFAFVPFHLNHVVHIQTMAGCYWPFVLYCLERYLSRASVQNAILLVATSVLTALSSLYFGLFLLPVIALYAILCWMLGLHRFRLRTLEGLLGAGLACAVLLLPIILPYLRFGSEHGYYHAKSELVRFSLEALAVVKLPQWLAFWSHGPFPLRKDWTPAFPGVAASLLALAFLSKRQTTGEERQRKVILALLAFVCFVLSLGPVLKIHAFVPSRYAKWIPLPGKIFLLYSGIRWPMRILLFSFLFGAIFCGLGFSHLTRLLNPGRRLLAASAMVLLLFLEYRPQSYYAADSVGLAAPLEVSEAYPFLATEADRGGVIELPVLDPDGDRTPYLVRYIYGSAGHLRRVVALHGTVIPSLSKNLLGAAEGLPSEASRHFLVAWGVSRLVLHREPSFVDLSPLENNALIRAGYRVLFDGKNATVFAVEDPRPRRISNAP